MRDYWLTQYLLAGVGWGYIFATLIAIALALSLPNARKAKAIVTAVVVGLASILPIEGYQEYRKVQEAAEAYKARLAKAQALFAKRCKTAGEKIYKTVDNVEGVLLMKVRPDRINFSDQYAMDDPFGADCHGLGCIADLLRNTNRVRSWPENAVDRRAGFNWVEAVDADDMQLYRYIGMTKLHPSGDPYFVTEKAKTTTSKARFGVTYDDISTREDRDLWIAGGSLKVIDLTTKEIIAERIGFMIDLGQGNTRGERSPWAFAYDHACPKFPVAAGGGAMRAGHTREFVFSVLHSEKTE